MFTPLTGYSIDGAALRRLRLAIPMSIDELAGEAGMSHMTVRALETESRTPRPETIRRIAEALNCDPSDFMVIDDGQDSAAI